MTLLVGSISTSHRRPLVNEFTGLHITRAFHACGGAPLTGWTSLIALLPLANRSRTPHLALTFICLFLHRSHALFEGTPGIVSCEGVVLLSNAR